MNRVTESNTVLMDAWDAMSHLNPHLERLRGGLMEISWAAKPILFFNLAVTARPPASLAEFEAAVRQTQDWAAPRKFPWLLAVCHETMGPLLDQARQSLDRLGFVPLMPLTGMVAESLAASSRARPQAEYRGEQDPALGYKVMRINEAAYQMPLGEPGSFSLEHDGWWSAPDRMATVVEVEGRPVSCTAVLGVGGLRYVALVATLPEAQRNGYAEAAMRDVLARSLQAGLNQRTYLHASAAGRPVYEKMGYQATAEYTLFLLKEFLPAEH